MKIFHKAVNHGDHETVTLIDLLAPGQVAEPMALFLHLQFFSSKSRLLLDLPS